MLPPARPDAEVLSSRGRRGRLVAVIGLVLSNAAAGLAGADGEGSRRRLPDPRQAAVLAGVGPESGRRGRASAPGAGRPRPDASR